MVTKYNPYIHKRQSTRLRGYDYSAPGAYFITICTAQGECLFGNIVDGKMLLNGLGRVVEKEWLKTIDVRKNIRLDEFIIMPNHFHAIIIINENIVRATRRVATTPGIMSGSLGAIIGQFKSLVTKQINQIRKTPGYPVWQRNYYDRIIRNESELYNARKYIINNPKKTLNNSTGEAPPRPSL